MCIRDRYEAPLFVLKIAPGGAAEKDGKLRVTDEILEINGYNTENMLHSDAISVIKNGGNTVKLVIRRAIEDGYQEEHFLANTNGNNSGVRGPHDNTRSPSNSSAANMKYYQDYMDSLKHQRRN